jgi:hypothetical protein
MDPKSGFFFLEFSFCDSAFAAPVVVAYVTPELAVHSPGGFQVPARVYEFFHRDSLVRVPRLVGFHELFVKPVVLHLESDTGLHHLLQPHTYHGDSANPRERSLAVPYFPETYSQNSS